VGEKSYKKIKHFLLLFPDRYTHILYIHLVGSISIYIFSFYCSSNLPLQLTCFSTFSISILLENEKHDKNKNIFSVIILVRTREMLRKTPWSKNKKYSTLSKTYQILDNNSGLWLYGRKS
jgi:hypothetical protein